MSGQGIAALTDLDPTEVVHGIEVGLSTEEFDKATELVGRAPNKLELGLISAMWSEHCSYKSSRVHLAKLSSKGERVLVGPGENAGVVDIGDNLAVCFKVESHNHPSFIEPFQGAATGVGGILRDVFTMGARPIACLNLLRFGAASHRLTPHLLKGVVGGIAHYGNCFGVPTVGTDVAFDAAYNGNILVNAFALGVLKHDGIFLGRAEGAGNPVFYVGAKTGRDGIHGATMASDTFSEEKEAARPTVQVGDPFKEKLLLEACQEAFAADLLIGIQDMGAAGLTSSAFEMASRAGGGITLHLDRVPTREVGMTPYELMLSESQERMLLVARPGCEDDLIAIYKKWELDCVQVGVVTDDGKVRLHWHGEEVAALNAADLADNAPKYERPYQRPADRAFLFSADDAALKKEKPSSVLKRLLGHPTQADSRWVTRQFDHHIGIGTLLGPGESAAPLVQIPGTEKGIGMTLLCNEVLCAVDPREGAARAVAEGVLRLACVGATPVGITNCLNFGSPEVPGTMWELVESVEGLAEMAGNLKIPVVSGNVSLYNETDGASIHPTPAVGVIGLNESPQKAVGEALRASDDLVILLGWLPEDLGGSAALAQAQGRPAGMVGSWNSESVNALAESVRMAVENGAIHGATVVGRGGIATALSKMAIRGGHGVNVTLPRDSEDLDSHILCFGEDQPGVLVTLRPNRMRKLMGCLWPGVPMLEVGTVGGNHVEIRVGGEMALRVPLEELKTPFMNALPQVASGIGGSGGEPS
jgi:phosphoribosylformylglycinamidine synthase